MKTKKDRTWIDDNKTAAVFSLVVAAIIWIVVAMTVGRAEYRQDFDNVPLDVEIKTGELSRMDLNLIEAGLSQVSATVEGDRVAITALRPEDLIATVEITPDLSVGSYSLKLVPLNQNYDKTSLARITYSPEKVSLKLDRLDTKTFSVEAQVNGISFQPDFILGAQTVTPAQVTLKGPGAELDKIQKCVISVELTDDLTKTYAEDFPIKALDATGNVIGLEENHLSVDYDEARFVIELLKVTGLKLRVDFTNVPSGFPLDELDYMMTTDFVEVAAPLDVVNRSSEILLGHIDLRSVTLDSDTFEFPLNIPSYYKNQEQFDEITVQFNSEKWDEAYFSVKDIELINVPDKYKVEVIGDPVYNVRFTGRADILADMTPDDIVLIMDLSERNLVNGQQQVPFKISAPTKGFVWAAGEYNAIIQATPLD